MILLSIPGYRYYQLNQERDLFLEAAEIRNTASEINLQPRKKILDRNGIELATDILRPTLLFKNENDKNIAKDILLLKSQAERCKEILQRFSKNPLKLRDKFLEKVKITDLIKINFEKFNKGKSLNMKNIFQLLIILRY